MAEMSYGKNEPGDERDPIEPRRTGISVWAKLLGVAVLTGATLVVVPRVASRGGDGPPIALLLGIGAVVALLCGLAMYWVVRRDWKMTTAAAFYAVGFNVLVIVVKFVLSPYGVYEFSRTGRMESYLPLNDTLGAVVAAIVVFLLYALVYWIVYRIVRGRVESGKPGKLRLILPLVAGITLLAVVSGTGVIFLLLAAEGLNYVAMVFSSVLAVFTGLALAGATALVVLCFRETRERAQVTGDVSLLLGMFWLGLAFLALYHVLWVVYILVLTTLWPLKVVTPK